MARSLRITAMVLVLLLAAASAGARKAGAPPGSEASSACFKATSSGTLTVGRLLAVSLVGERGARCRVDVGQRPANENDFAGPITYFLGDIPGLGTKVVKFVHRVF